MRLIQKQKPLPTQNINTYKGKLTCVVVGILNVKLLHEIWLICANNSAADNHQHIARMQMFRNLSVKREFACFMHKPYFISLVLSPHA